MKLQLLHTSAEIEINTLIRFILMGLGLILLLFIINAIFTGNISSGFDSFFTILE